VPVSRYPLLPASYNEMRFKNGETNPQLLGKYFPVALLIFALGILKMPESRKRSDGKNN
jgi:hypothetical protein